MEKVQIVRYALMQIVAVIYSVLASGTAVKVDTQTRVIDFGMPPIYQLAVFISDYGFLFLGIGIIWIIIVFYLSSPFARLEVSAGALTWSGIIVALSVAIAGTIIAFGAVAVFQSGTTGLPVR